MFLKIALLYGQIDSNYTLHLSRSTVIAITVDPPFGSLPHPFHKQLASEERLNLFPDITIQKKSKLQQEKGW